MDAKTLTPRSLFDGLVQYVVPPFQRPYVWTEIDQWQPLWDDVSRVVEDVLEDPSRLECRHFLGAVVVKQEPTPSGDPLRRSVIDGQQRLTTLQLLLDAAAHVAQEHDQHEVGEVLEELVFNKAARFNASSKRFKLWPSRADRGSFEVAIAEKASDQSEVVDSNVVAAHAFFRAAIAQWLDEESSFEAAVRLKTLAEVLQSGLQIVCIDLSDRDDDQLIFETLNDRGTPLLAVDLIKNFIFQRCEQLSVDVDDWVARFWLDFDGPWWREEIPQGRLLRSRSDLFMQYWLTARTREEVPSDAVFHRFRAYAADQLGDTNQAEQFLSELKAEADAFRDFANLDPSSARGRFYRRVVEALELGVFIPVLLWLASGKHTQTKAEGDKALAALESWAVRRTLLRRTSKDNNRLVVALLRELHEHPPEAIGDATAAFLARQTADSRAWPSDAVLLDELPSIKVYGNVKQTRLRSILEGVELELRGSRNEAVSLPDRLAIEHILPQGWRSYWDDGRVGDLHAEADRDRLLDTIGNLTLVNASLNSALSNRPWTDDEAAKVAPNGKDAGLGKRSLLNRFSLLQLNKDVVDQHPAAWDDDCIRARSIALAGTICRVWPGPSEDGKAEGGGAGDQPAASARVDLGGRKQTEATDAGTPSAAGNDGARKRAFWDALLLAFDGRDHPHAGRSSTTENWLDGRSGLSQVAMHYRVRAESADVSVLFQRKAAAENQFLFALLREMREDLAEAFGSPFVWDEKPGKNKSEVVARTWQTGVRDESRWPTLHSEMSQAMLALDAAFRPYLKAFADVLAAREPSPTGDFSDIEKYKLRVRALEVREARSDL